MSQLYFRPAGFRVASVFSDRMVLQRQKNIHVFGEGVDGCRVFVRLTLADGSELTARAVAKDGRWLAVLPPAQVQTGCTLTVESETGECRRFSQVAIGEVWLAGGQSNMELELQNCAGGQQTLAQEPPGDIRFYYTPKSSYMDRGFYEAEEASRWETFGPESARCWSAVGYYFAERLAQAFPGIPLGILGCNWGGTSASAWMSRDALLEDRDLASYVREYEAACAGISVEEQERAYDEYLAFHTQWDRQCVQLYIDDPAIEWSEVERILGKCQWPGPMNCKNPFRPGGLYETMLLRVCPYSMRGFLFYQGESDDHKPQLYYRLLTRMIRQWREDFLDPEMPFLMVQLTMHRYKQDPDFGNWPLIRQAQMDVYRTVKNTGIAVIIDRGEFNNIHPLDKRTVGIRLALQALAQVYGMLPLEQAFGPVYERCEFTPDALVLRFRYAREGFVGEVSGFEIAGEDGRYVPARVAVEGDSLRLWADGLSWPRYARYLWTNYGPVTFFGANGLPVAPFRTDPGDGFRPFDQNAQIRQIMEV